AMMRGRSGAMPPTVRKNCLTKEKLANHMYTPDRPGTKCTHTVNKSTSTVLDMTETCTGTSASTTQLHIEAPTPTQMTLTGKETEGRGAGVTVNMTAKWLSADCGDIK